MSTDDRHIEPSDFLLSPGCRLSSVLTVGNKLPDSHEREVIKAGAKFRWYGHMSADTMIGSQTTRGYLTTTGKIVHGWDWDN